MRIHLTSHVPHGHNLETFYINHFTLTYIDYINKKRRNIRLIEAEFYVTFKWQPALETGIFIDQTVNFLIKY